jgi:glucosamine--fructose-6-phosphate aminotransferase (isomerizing)
VSRSGLTTETLHAFELYQKAKRGDTLAVTCYADSPLAKMAPAVFITSAGMEDSVAQTRSFSNMMWPIIALAEKDIPDDLIEKIGKANRSLLDKYQDTAGDIGANLRSSASSSSATVRFLGWHRKSC